MTPRDERIRTRCLVFLGAEVVVVVEEVVEGSLEPLTLERDLYTAAIMLDSWKIRG